MKGLLFLLFSILLLSSCAAQERYESRINIINEIPDLISSLPFSLSEETPSGERRWKSTYTYLDSISVNEITYQSDSLAVNGFLILPDKTGSHPCIIWNRGGVKEFGAINLLTASAILGKLSSSGYVVIATQYRGNAGGEGQEEYGGTEITDVLNLIEILNSIPQADTSRIGMFGGSRGGMMTYIALTKTDRIKAAAVLGAPSDAFASIRDRPSLENSLYKLVEGYEENKKRELDKRSAIKWVEKFPKNVPLLIMHGNADWRVKSEQSLRLALALDKHRVPYRLKIYEGGDHGLTEFRGEFYEDLINWFDKYVKNGASLPNMDFHGN